MANIKTLYMEVDGVVEPLPLPEIAKRLGIRRDTVSRSKRLAESDGKDSFKCGGFTIYISPPKYETEEDGKKEAVLRKSSGPLLKELCRHRLGYCPNKW